MWRDFQRSIVQTAENNNKFQSLTGISQDPRLNYHLPGNTSRITTCFLLNSLAPCATPKIFIPILSKKKKKTTFFPASLLQHSFPISFLLQCPLFYYVVQFSNISPTTCAAVACPLPELHPRSGSQVGVSAWDRRGGWGKRSGGGTKASE